MKKGTKIIIVAQDMGGFNAVFPVIKELKKRKNPLKILLAGKSRERAQKLKINYQDAGCLDDKALSGLLEKERPGLLFTAISIGESIEKRMTKIARMQKIKTCTIADFWTNPRLCFGDLKTEKLDYLPDYFLVIDEIMKKEMIELGFNPGKIFITGSPFFDSFSKLANSKQEEKIISFFCDPFSEIFKKKDRGFLGFDEIQVFKDLVGALEKLQIKLPFIVKFHPRAKKLNKFDKIIKNSRLKILIEKKLSAEELIKKSKLVTGMNSVVLFQAAMIGKAVLSYQPNLNRPDPLVSNRLGLSKGVYRKKELYPALKKLLSNKAKKKNFKLMREYTHNKSTQKVMRFITNILKNE